MGRYYFGINLFSAEDWRECAWILFGIACTGGILYGTEAKANGTVFPDRGTKEKDYLEPADGVFLDFSREDVQSWDS
jgi:hypothetical protein